MNFKNLLPIALFSLALTASAQEVQSGTNTISGLVRFVNTDPDILARLGPPGNEGITSFAILAYTDPPDLLQASKVIYSADPLSSPYALTVTANNVPLTYHAYAYFGLDTDEEYWTPVQDAAPLTSNSPPATLNFDECVALLELRYVDAAGQPFAALGGRASVTETNSPFSLRARYSVQPPGRTNNFLVVPSAVALELVVEVDTGTDIYLDRLTHRETHSLMLDCEDQPVITITVPDAGALGKIIGNANLVDEIELPTDGYLELLGRPVIKAVGPSGNQRYDALPAETPGADLSRAFELENLVPSVSTQAWRVQAEMQFGDGYRFQYFQTPALGVGLNTGVEVTAGGTNDLGDTFVMHPARLVGKITLTGPPEPGGSLSALRGLVRAADYDPDTNGIPDGVGPGGIHGSYVNVAGVDELAPGATFATIGASASASFAGAFNPATAAFEGDYEVVLGMLDDQPGIWRQESLSYIFYQLDTNGAPFVNQIGNVAENLPWQGTLAPGERATNDLRYGFAEVCLRIKSPLPFYSPRINVSGGLTGLDSEGQLRSYRVGSDYAYGRPETAATAANEGLVTMYLPEGTYTLSAAITTIDPGGGESTTQLPAIDVTVAAGEKLCVEDCIQVFIEPPMCTTNFGFLARANASSCDGTLTNLSLRASPLSDPSIRLGYSDIRILIGSRTNLTTAHGLFLEFDGFPKSYYEDILYTATTMDNQGRVATRQIIAHYDFIPPALNCQDIIVTATNGVDALVDFAVSTASDLRQLVCNPASGSTFPLGTNLVSCTAKDLCYNTNTCTFNVIVLPPTNDCIQVFIEPPMCATNFGFLARANATSCDGTLTNLSLRASPLSDPSIRLGYSDIRILIGSRTNLTTAHGLFPEFDGFNNPDLYKDILYTATAIDIQGRVATRQIIAHYDWTPPVMNCPDIIVTATNGSDAVVDFNVTTATDLYQLICTPPSGSAFPLGTNLVSCLARDACRNTNTCSFNVIVLPASVPDCTLQVEIAQPDPLTLTLTWDCAGTLESAPSVDGPWDDVTDATSPHPEPVLPGNRFFRVRRDFP